MPLKRILSEENVESDPVLQFAEWYKEHLNSGISIPESVSLGTSASDGSVSVRTVLLKSYNEAGFYFFTNYYSKKAIQLSENPFAALLFYWPESGRQVRIEGKAEKVSEDESDRYFNTRPRESQLSAWASRQSTVISSRQYLDNEFEKYKNEYQNKSVRRPSHWGGYRLVPGWFEFWHDGESRLHDRIVYTRINDSWKIERLAP